ncbi:MAG: thiamine pyrophosphate-binding protein [Rhodospirillaceae bacterium]|nr:thiamine pyrophosphate-binding protein [Rhodospirillaceae bacterium]MBT6139144.1 thiamine pyrophosphate-binding protein [Rhodospirillaceae bacterium]
MNELTGAEAMVRMLQAHGVDTIFGLCGDTSLPFYDALYRIGGKTQHVLSRDERSAAYMADCYARVSGKVGICEGPSGGGATYILPGVVEANESSVPIMAITTDIAVSSRGRFALTELDQQALFRPLSKWNQVIDRSADVPKVMRAAFRAMTTGRPGATHIGLPFDVQKGPVDEANVWADEALGRYPAWRSGPDPAAVEAAAEALVSASFPVIVCGGGVVISGAEAELLRLAEALGCVVATTISGQGSIPETHPLGLGVVGSNGGVIETRAVVEKADLVFFIGCRAGSVTTERWQFPAPGSAKVVHLDIDPAVIGANYETAAALVGDARLGLAAIADAVTELAPKQVREAKAVVENAKRAKYAAFNALAESNETPIKPERVVATLRRLLDDDAIIVADPGTPCPYLSGFYEIRETGRTLISNRAHGALGYSMAGAVGASFGRPGVKVVSVMGDGSFGFTSGELETIVRLGVPVTMIVFSNSVFGWIKAGQKTGFEERYYSVDFSRTDHARVAEAFGVKAWQVEDPSKLEGALKAALAHDGPSLVDVIAQPLQDAKAPVSEWVA